MASMTRFKLFWATMIASALYVLAVTSIFAQETKSDMADIDPSLVGNVNLENWEIACAFITTIFLGVILQSKWATRTKALVSFGFAFVTSGIGLGLQNQFSFSDDLLGSGLKVFIISIPIYYGLVKHLGIKAKTDNIL